MAHERSAFGGGASGNLQPCARGTRQWFGGSFWISDLRYMQTGGDYELDSVQAEQQEDTYNSSTEGNMIKTRLAILLFALPVFAHDQAAVARAAAGRGPNEVKFAVQAD